MSFKSFFTETLISILFLVNYSCRESSNGLRFLFYFILISLFDGNKKFLRPIFKLFERISLSLSINFLCIVEVLSVFSFSSVLFIYFILWGFSSELPLIFSVTQDGLSDRSLKIFIKARRLKKDNLTA